VSGFEIRPARREDGRAMAELFAAVAAERDGIATEPPIDIRAWTTEFADASEEIIVAVAGKELVGSLLVEKSFFNFGEVAMHVARGWRGRGVGSALLAAGIEKARGDGLHKLSLDVFPHNEAGIALYRKFGFVEEGRRIEAYRRQTGEYLDTIMMGLLL
jgi:L-amino acid N-acyltransferase YncA